MPPVRTVGFVQAPKEYRIPGDATTHFFHPEIGHRHQVHWPPDAAGPFPEGQPAPPPVFDRRLTPISSLDAKR